MALVVIPRQTSITLDGIPRVGAYLYFYEVGTNTPIDTYTTPAYSVLHENPVPSNDDGYWPEIHVNPAVNPTYKMVCKDADGLTLWTSPTQSSVASLTASAVGAVLYPRTEAEIASSVTPTDYSYTPNPIDVRRYGIVPNDPLASSDNDDALEALLNPEVDGPTGDLCFYPVDGNDIYYFSRFMDVRPGITLRTFNTHIRCVKDYSALTDDGRAFLNFIRDGGIIGPGSVRLECDTTAGDGAGACVRFGSRSGRPFGIYSAGIFDKTDLTDEDLPPMGNLRLENITIESNNPAEAIMVMFGGIAGMTIKNVTFNGLGLCPRGPLYEFGWADANGSPDDEDWTSSHATCVEITNVVSYNYDSGSGDSAFELTGCWEADVTNLTCKDADYAFTFRPGEALYYDPWTPHGTSSNRQMRMRGVRGYNCANGIQLKGAEAASGGYLSGEGLTAQQQTDLMNFSLDGFEMVGNGTSGAGLSVSGPCDIRNGAVTGFFNALVLGDECVRFKFTNVQLLDSADVGIRGNFGDKIFSTARKKLGVFESCFVAGSTGVGVSLGNTAGVHLRVCRFGYSEAYDGTGVTEDDQTYSVGLASTAAGVVVDTCHSTIKSGGGGVSYDSAGTSDRGNNIVNPQGDVTYTAGVWQIDGVASATQAALEDIAHDINTKNKYPLKKVHDSTNTIIRYATTGDTNGTWDGMDGSAALTPV